MPRGGLRIGTRGSALSTWQARWVADRLAPALPGRSVEIVTISTRGDRDQSPFTELTVAGVFTSELEIALVEGRVDVAVHSLKDLPASDATGLAVISIPLRGDPADAVVSRGGHALAALPAGARVGTSSPRRACLVRAARADVDVVPLRGNVDTRVRHLDEGRYDAVILAVAGLVRLGLEGKITERLDPREFPPAPGQGALALQARGDDEELIDALIRMDDSAARRTASAERSCLVALGGGCSRPIGAHAWLRDEDLTVFAFVGSADGGRVLRAEESGRDPHEVGRLAAQSLIDQGAKALLA
jgi:hydroxymethylbilane synthase